MAQELISFCEYPLHSILATCSISRGAIFFLYRGTTCWLSHNEHEPVYPVVAGYDAWIVVYTYCIIPLLFVSVRPVVVVYHSSGLSSVGRCMNWGISQSGTTCVKRQFFSSLSC
jgi:hypothetical protein